MPSKKVTWIIIAVSFALATGVIFYSNDSFYEDYKSNTEMMSNSPLPSRPEIDGVARVEMDFGNGLKRAFEGEVSNNPYPLITVLDVISEEGNFKWAARDGKIAGIAGVANQTGSWKIYKNGSLKEEGLEQLSVTGGDRYVLRFEPR